MRVSPVRSTGGALKCEKKIIEVLGLHPQFKHSFCRRCSRNEILSRIGCRWSVKMSLGRAAFIGVGARTSGEAKVYSVRGRLSRVPPRFFNLNGERVFEIRGR